MEGMEASSISLVEPRKSGRSTATIVFWSLVDGCTYEKLGVRLEWAGKRRHSAKEQVVRQ